MIPSFIPTVVVVLILVSTSLLNRHGGHCAETKKKQVAQELRQVLRDERTDSVAAPAPAQEEQDLDYRAVGTGAEGKVVSGGGGTERTPPPPPLLPPVGRTAIIAELVGLSTLKGFALLAFPLLIPIILAALAVLTILPIPILAGPIGAIGRRLGGSSGGAGSEEIDDVLGEIVQSTKCLERISCEIGRSVRTPQVRTIIDQSFSELSSQLEGKWKGSLQGYIIGSRSRTSRTNPCVKFKCKIGRNPL